MKTEPNPSDREVLAGLVERVTYQNSENGFCVIRVKARSHRDLVTVVGHAATISAGEWITASGDWVNDRTHGQQFKARFLKASEPTSAEGIEKYLASGMIRGIGPAYAKKLVRAFKEKVFDVIEATPDRLREVDGIGPVRAASILAAWAEQKAVREIMVFLHSHGVGTARAVRIFKTYGADAIQVMTENPYRLARDIRGIGFKTADGIAMKLGIEKTAMVRVRAGISYALTEAMDEGHCGLPTDELVPLAVKLLEVPQELVRTALNRRFGRRSLVGRSVDYLSFYRSVRRRLLDMARAGDIVIAKTDPPLLAVVAMPAAHRRGAHVINWLQDIYPETAMVLGVPLMRGPAAAVSAAWRDRSLRRAAATVVVGDLMARKVEALGAPPARVHVIANWCNDEDIRPLAGARNPLREAWGLDGKFVLGYSGNLGRAHEFDTVLAAAEALRHDSRIVFLMIGGGKRFDDLAGIVRQRRLDGAFRFMPYQPRELLPYSLAAADLHWLSLNPALEGLIVPSKFYGIAAAGKPMIVIAAQDGKLARLVQQFDCGIVIAPGDAAALVGTVLRLSTDDRALARMGMCARHMLEGRFTRQRAFAQWVALFDRIEASVAPDERSAPTLADRPD